VAQGGSGSVALNARVLASGQPVAGRTVQYAVTQGVAGLSSTTAVSNAAGYAGVSLNLNSVQGEVHASACVMPGAAPCSSFYIFVVPASQLRLQFVAGEQQVINTAQAFSPVTLRVTDSLSPPNPVQMATVALISAVMRWQLPPVAGGPKLPPAAPVVLSSAQRLIYSDASGLVSILPVADARLGAVVVKMIGIAGTGLPLQLEAQRLWAPPGFVGSSGASQPAIGKYQLGQRSPSGLLARKRAVFRAFCSSRRASMRTRNIPSSSSSMAGRRAPGMTPGAIARRLSSSDDQLSWFHRLRAEIH
jgi:hypothetical protein